MHTLRSWGLGTSEAINFRRYRSTCAIHHSCIANHLSRSEGQALRARDLRHIGICSLEHQSLPMIRLDSRSVAPPFGIGITPSFGDCASALLGPAGPSTSMSSQRAARTGGKAGETSPWPADDWSVVCGWSTRSAARLAVRAARHRSAVTVVR